MGAQASDYKDPKDVTDGALIEFALSRGFGLHPSLSVPVPKFLQPSDRILTQHSISLEVVQRLGNPPGKDAYEALGSASNVDPYLSFRSYDTLYLVKGER